MNDDKNKQPELDRLPNPGLKDEKAANKKSDLLNEDPTEEKEAIEKTSEDRLDGAE